MKGVMISLYLLIVLTLSQAITIDKTCKSPVSIDAACRNAAESHSAIAFEHCVSSLSSDPRSEAAPDVHGLAVLATKLAIEHASTTEYKFDDLLELETADHMRGRFDACLDVYSHAAERLRDALDNLHARIYRKATEQIEAALGAAEHCEGVWKGEEGAPVAGHEREYGRLAILALGLTNSVE